MLETAVGVVMKFPLEPTPIWPFALYPQHFIVPSVRRAQVWYELAATLVTSEMSGTAVGAVGTLMSPLSNPSCFWELLPQHITVPFVSDAQVWHTPQATLVAEYISDTAVGLTLSTWELSPSWPKPFFPQHITDPSFSTLHVW
jgi:hypothetical protein